LIVYYGVSVDGNLLAVCLSVSPY